MGKAQWDTDDEHGAVRKRDHGGTTPVRTLTMGELATWARHSDLGSLPRAMAVRRRD